MKGAMKTVKVRTLGREEQSTSTDPTACKVGTLTRHDVISLRAELDGLDELEHPWGPFSTYQRHLEYILSEYDAALAQAYAAHAISRKG